MNMKPGDVNSSTYIAIGIENSETDLKFEVGDHVKVSKYKSMFGKGHAPNFGKEVFVVNYCISDIFY